jgi:hypothetical protein
MHVTFEEAQQAIEAALKKAKELTPCFSKIALVY